MFKIAAIITTYNRKKSVIHLLELLEKQIAKSIDLSISIIVVVDGSTDGTREAIRCHFPAVTIVEGDGNWWWTRSVNEGCKQAVNNGVDAVLLLNDDVQLGNDYLETLLKSVEQEPGTIIGSLNIVREKEERIFFSGAAKFQWWIGKLQRYHPFLALCPKNLSGLHQSVILPGRGVLIPTEVFKKIGYFDEKALPQYKADYEFVLRANKNNIKTLISWDTVIFVNVRTTGKGATFTRQSFLTFFASLFKKNSRTNLYRNFLYYKRFYPLWALPLLPFTAFMIAVRQLLLFLKDRKY
jgi:GT2 family glycosyltransferase